MQSSVPELLASLCPEDAEVELYNEKETDVPLDRDWDLVFFSYLHAYYEHTKVLSTLFRRRGMKTVAGGRHASHFPEDCARHFDAIVVGDPEPNVPRLIEDFRVGALASLYAHRAETLEHVRPYRHDLVDFRTNPTRLPAIEASRGCPFSCNFCVLTGTETYRYRPIANVVDEIRHHMAWNQGFFGRAAKSFVFLDNNLGGSPRYLEELCDALAPLGKTWGCALTFNVLRNPEMVRTLARGGCRYVYTGLESFNEASLASMDKRQNKLSEVDAVLRDCYKNGIFLSFGLLVGADGDTDEYLSRLSAHLGELRYASVTFVGIVCPFPGTPFYESMRSAGRLLKGALSRDFDGYTLCHTPKDIEASELVDHFQRLCKELSSLSRLALHYWNKLGASDALHYKEVVLGSAREMRSIRSPVENPVRRYIAGLDPIERWDEERMAELGLSPQKLA